jgi:DNA replication and repair protein RecF
MAVPPGSDPPEFAPAAAGASLTLLRLRLTAFRSYRALVWSPGGRIVVIAGPNGSGKTNLLEAVSLLAPGRGLRGARVSEFAQRRAAEDPASSCPGGWAVAGRFATPGGVADIGTGSPQAGPPDRRIFRLDGATPRAQAEIAERIAMVWLTPRMDQLFHDGAATRRRFLDRLVWALEPGHAREVAAHDAAMASRNRLLAAGRPDPAWLAALEDAMARHGIAATAARAALVARLDDALAGALVPGFPAVRVRLEGAVAARLAGAPALAAEDWLRASLAENRGRDAAAGVATVSAHRCDLGLVDLASGHPAMLASTGEQKAMLVGLILAHAGLIAAARGFAPILLLDEPAVHLDQDRRAALFAALAALPAQVLLTGADPELFRPLAGVAAFWRAGGHTLAPAAWFGEAALP